MGLSEWVVHQPRNSLTSNNLPEQRAKSEHIINSKPAENQGS